MRDNFFINIYFKSAGNYGMDADEFHGSLK